MAPPVPACSFKNIVIECFRLLWYILTVSRGWGGTTYTTNATNLLFPCILLWCLFQYLSTPSWFLKNVIYVVPHIICCHPTSPPSPYPSSCISIIAIPILPCLHHHDHCLYPPQLCHRHFGPAFIVACLLLPLTFIVYYNHLDPLLLLPPFSVSAINLTVQYYFFAMIISLLFNLLVQHWFLWSALLLSPHSKYITLIHSALLAPLFLLRSNILDTLQFATFYP